MLDEDGSRTCTWFLVVRSWERPPKKRQWPLCSMVVDTRQWAPAGRLEIEGDRETT